MAAFEQVCAQLESEGWTVCAVLVNADDDGKPRFSVRMPFVVGMAEEGQDATVALAAECCLRGPCKTDIRPAPPDLTRRFQEIEVGGGRLFALILKPYLGCFGVTVLATAGRRYAGIDHISLDMAGHLLVTWSNRRHRSQLVRQTVPSAPGIV